MTQRGRGVLGVINTGRWSWGLNLRLLTLLALFTHLANIQGQAHLKLSSAICRLPSPHCVLNTHSSVRDSTGALSGGRVGTITLLASQPLRFSSMSVGRSELPSGSTDYQGHGVKGTVSIALHPPFHGSIITSQLLRHGTLDSPLSVGTPSPCC